MHLSGCHSLTVVVVAVAVAVCLSVRSVAANTAAVVGIVADAAGTVAVVEGTVVVGPDREHSHQHADPWSSDSPYPLTLSSSPS